MAKVLLWVFVVANIIVITFGNYSNENVFKYPQWSSTMFWAVLCVLAICEAIESLKGEKN